DPSRLEYVGHTGTGFDQKELARVWKLLKARETTESPFTTRFKTNEPAHWVKPELVAQVRFTEWTADRKLRHPVYLGLRDDKRPADVVVEIPNQADAPKAPSRTADHAPRTARTADRGPRAAPSGPRTADRAPRTQHVVEQLQALED